MLHIDMWAQKQVILSCCRDMVVCCVAFFGVRLRHQISQIYFEDCMRGKFNAYP